LSYNKNNKISNVKVKIVDIRRKAINESNYLKVTDINDTWVRGANKIRDLGSPYCKC